jgi:hypothetical protein
MRESPPQTCASHSPTRRKRHYDVDEVQQLSGAPASSVRRAVTAGHLKDLRSVIAWVNRQRAARGMGPL